MSEPQPKVAFVRIPPVRRVCDDCGAVTTEAVMPGQHGTHLAKVEGRIALVNCRGVVLA